MKTLISASILALASSAAIGDWEDVWQNPDLSVNFEGYQVTQPTPAQDQVEASFPGNPDEYAGGNTQTLPAIGATSYDEFVRGNPDIDVCGCI